MQADIDRHQKTRGEWLRAGCTDFSMMPFCQCLARRVKFIFDNPKPLRDESSLRRGAIPITSNQSAIADLFQMARRYEGERPADTWRSRVGHPTRTRV